MQSRISTLPTSATATYLMQQCVKVDFRIEKLAIAGNLLGSFCTLAKVDNLIQIKVILIITN